MSKFCKSCDKLFTPKCNRQKYCCPTCSKKAKLKKQQKRGVRLPKSMRSTKEIYQWTKAIMGFTKDEYDHLFRKIKQSLKYAKTPREKQLLRTRLTVIRDLRQHSGLYSDLKKGCKTCRFWKEGECNLGNKREGCEDWEQNPHLWVTEDREGRREAEMEDEKDVYDDQEDW